MSRAVPDPRFARDGLGRQAWQVAQSKHGLPAEVLDALRPQAPLEYLFPARSLALVGAPTLSILAAAALREHLTSALQALDHQGQQQQQEQQGAEQREAEQYCSASLASTSHAAVQLCGPGSEGGCRAADVAICGICLEGGAGVQLQGCCRHALCSGCALQLVQQVYAAPVPCPFCRVPMRGFETA